MPGKLTISYARWYRFFAHGIPHQFDRLEDLRQVKCLAHVHHPDRTIELELLHLLDGQRDVLGGIQRAAVGAQDDQYPVLVLRAGQSRPAG